MNCVICSQPITGLRATRWNVKTCSDECRVMLNRKIMREHNRMNARRTKKYCVSCGAEIEVRLQSGRAAKQCPACRALRDSKVERQGHNSEAPLTLYEKQAALKLMVWLDAAKERMDGAKACINLQELVGAWQEIKTIPLVLAD